MLILVSLIFTGIGAAPAFGLNLGDKLPVVVLAALDKNSVRPDGSLGGFHTSQTLGKVTMLNFWATWCEACKVELLEMEKNLKVLKSEKDFRFVFVNLDKDPSQGIEWAKQNLADPALFLTHNVMDPQFSVTEKLGVDSFPMTLVINRQGSLRYIQRGYTPGKGLTEKLVTLLRKELQTPPDAH
jgi:thiol-disulfide isomerase/thioredoxin